MWLVMQSSWRKQNYDSKISPFNHEYMQWLCLGLDKDLIVEARTHDNEVDSSGTADSPMTID